MRDPSSSIAILDDDPYFREALRRVLNVQGFECTTFATGGQLLHEVTERCFSCLILDLDMPGMSGFEVLTALHRSAMPPPVLVLTGHDSPAHRARAFALHAAAFLTKPIRASVLLSAIADASRRSPEGP